MNDFKFNCPQCGQHILANASWIGRRLSCPSCNADITVPAPTKPQSKNAQPDVAPKFAKARPPSGTLRVQSPDKADKGGPVLATGLKETPAVAVPPDAKNRPPGPTGQTDVRVEKGKTDAFPEKAQNQAAPATVVPKETKAKSQSDTVQVVPPIMGVKAGHVTEKEVKKITPTADVPADTGPVGAGDNLGADAPPKSTRDEIAPTAAPQPAIKVTEAFGLQAKLPENISEAAPEAPGPREKPRIAALSATVKLDIVRAVRRRITDESAWLPGKVEGEVAYAAKGGEGKTALLDAKSSEATRFSLMGAFVSELHLRQVVATATGRKRFLDEEIPDAIREVLLEQMGEEERESAEDPLADKDLLAISHAQCLAVLDALEERYSQRMEQVRIEKAKRRLGNVRLADLVKKLEKKASVLPEDVATALYHELAEVRRRLEKLESRTIRNQ